VACLWKFVEQVGESVQAEVKLPVVKDIEVLLPHHETLFSKFIPRYSTAVQNVKRHFSKIKKLSP
jgi:hypothetical protein